MPLSSTDLAALRFFAATARLLSRDRSRERALPGAARGGVYERVPSAGVQLRIHLEKCISEAPAELARCTLLHDSHAWGESSDSAEWRHRLQETGAQEVDSTQGRFFTLANMAIEAAFAHQGVAMGRLALVEELLQTGRLVAPIARRFASPGK